MKKIYIVAAFLASFALGKAADFTLPGNNGTTWYFDWVEPGVTCKLADRTDIKLEYGPNQYDSNKYEYHLVSTSTGKVVNTWEVEKRNSLAWGSNKIPTTVTTTYNGKTVTADVIGIGKFSFVNGDVGSDYEIPSSIRFIDEGAFFKINQKSSLKLTDAYYIGKCAFYDSGIASVDIKFADDYDSYIAESAFEKSEGGGTLTSAHIENVDTICNKAFFKQASLLKSLKLVNVEYIGDYAFTGFDGQGHKSSSCGGSSCGITSLDLGDKVTHIGNYAFAECHGITTINIPNSVVWIGDYAFYHCIFTCPITFGLNVKHIGAWAFSGGTYQTCDNGKIIIPASCEYIGENAFLFNNEKHLQDVYVNAIVPPDMGVDQSEGETSGYSAFGERDESRLKDGAFWNDSGIWIYPSVCLHVPMGTYEAYATHPEWGKFSCIIDDLIPEEGDHSSSKDPLSYVIGYVYMVPGEKINIENDVLEDDGSEHIWEPVENEIVKIDANGNVEAKSLGNYIAVGKRKGSKIFDGNKWQDLEETVAGAVVIFVCPTITVLYDKTNVTNNESNSPAGAPRKASAVLQDEESQPVQQQTEIDQLAAANSTYTHRVVHNSFPKYYFETADPTTIEIETIERAKLTDDNEYIDGTDGLAPIDQETQMQVVQDTKDTNNSNVLSTYVVPINPVQENRVLALSMAIAVPSQLVHTVDTEVGSNITVSVTGNVLSINGAEDTDVVSIYNTAGQLVFRATDKTVQINQPGVYIVNVADASFKAIVK